MRLQNIINEQIRIENSLLLENICSDLLPQQRYIIEGIYAEFIPLIEATLTTDQVKTLFGTIEKQSIAGGQSRTLTGATVDVAKQANEVINNVGRWLQNTTPVKMADEKFEQLKSKIGAKFPDLDKQLTGFGTWMKENPGKSAAIIGVLTAVASLAGGPVGGAVAGQVLRGAAELIKGEKLSTAVGKGIKTAALGFIAGKAFEVLGNWMAGFREQSIPFGPADAGLERVSWGAGRSSGVPGFEWTRTTQGFEQLVRQEEAIAIRELMAQIKTGTDPWAFDKLYNLAIEIGSPEYKKALNGMVKGAWQAAKDNDSLLQFINTAKEGLQAGAQGAVAASTGTDSKEKKESYYLQTRPLSEGQIYLLFDHIEDYSKVEYITEGPMDALKKVGGAVAKGASWLGKQATEKITSAKLLASWKLEGSPTDSEELAKFLQGQGVEDSVINSSYEEMKLPAPNTKAPEEKPADEKKINTAELGKYGYDAYSGMAFTSPEDRAEYYQLIGKKDPGQSSKKPTLNPGAEPWDAEKFKKEELPYVQASDMVVKLPVDRQARLLQALLKASKAAPDAVPAEPTTTA